MSYRLVWTLVLPALACGRIGYERIGDGPLMVSTTEDRFAGPPTIASVYDLTAPGLSLREAITIANNRSGPQSIELDIEVFPSGSRTVIVLATPLPAISDAGTHLVGDARVAIDASALSGSAFTVQADDTVLEGLEIRGSVLATSITAQGVSALALRSNRFDPVGQGGIEVIDSTQVELRDNWMLLDGDRSAFGIRLRSVTGAVVARNFFDNGNDIEIELVDSSSNELAGNVLDGGALRLSGQSRENLLIRNLLIWNSGDCVVVEDPATSNTVVHNTFFTCSRNAILDDAGNTTRGNNLETALEAEFVDALAGDFHLAKASASVDAGADLGYDCWSGGPERFLGAAPDLGALETR